MKSEQKTLGFYPYPLEDGNDYTHIIIRAIQKSDKDIKVEPFSHPKILKHGKKYDYVWLNWFETLPTDFWGFFKFLFAKVLIILILKIRKTKIITAFHDKLPHLCRFQRINEWFIKFLLHNSSVILILSDGSLEYIKKYSGEKGLKKTLKLPHPAYNITKIKGNLPSKEFKVFFFGFLKPYKNVELLIDLAKVNPEISFTIAGKPVSEKYKQELETIINGVPNVTFIPQMLSDDEIDLKIKESSIIVLPYNLKSSLNSGVLFYAFSKGINVIIPRIASVDEFINRDDIYWYEYTDEKDHKFKLNQKLHEAYFDFVNSPEKFQKKIINLQEEVSKYSEDYLSDTIKKLRILE